MEGDMRTLSNTGDCPTSITKDCTVKYIIGDVLMTYYSVTWRIKTPEEDRDSGFGYFWKWFLAEVRFFSNVSMTFLWGRVSNAWVDFFDFIEMGTFL